MAKKTRITIDDDYNFDQSLDMPDFDFGESKIKDNRSPTTKVISSIPKGAMNGIKESAFLKKTAKALLPEGFGQAIDMSDTLHKTVKNIYDDSAKEMKPALREAKRVLPKLIPSDSKVTPKWMKDKLKQWEKEHTPQSSSVGLDEQRDNTISTAFADIFKIQLESTQRQAIDQESRDRLKEGIEFSRHKSLYELGNKQALSTSRIEQYFYNVDLAHKKKSLELQFRNLFALRDIYTHMKESDAKRDEFYQNLVKNTGLPDYAKITSLETLKNAKQKQFANSLSSGLFGSANGFVEKLGKHVSDTITSKVKGYAGAAVSGLQSAESGSDMASDLGDMGLDKHAMAGEMIGSNALQMAIGKLSRKYSGQFQNSKFGKWAQLGKRGNQLTHMTNNAGGYLKEFKESDLSDKNGMSGMLLRLLQDFTPGSGMDKQVNLMRGKDMYAPASLNNKTLNSINEVIPGYLARIFRELVVTRTGNQKIDLTRFDHENGKFTSADKLSKSILGAIVPKSSVKYTRDQLDNLVDEIERTTGPMSNEERKATRLILLRNKADGGTSNMTSLGKGRHYSGMGSQTTNSVRGRLAKHVGSLDDAGRAAFSKKHVQLDRYMSDTREMVQQYVEHGNLPELKRLGLVNQDGTIDISKLISLYANYGDETGTRDSIKSKTSTQVSFDTLLKYKVIGKTLMSGMSSNASYSINNYDILTVSRAHFKGNTTEAKNAVEAHLSNLRDNNVIDKFNNIDTSMLSDEVGGLPKSLTSARSNISSAKKKSYNSFSSVHSNANKPMPKLHMSNSKQKMRQRFNNSSSSDSSLDNVDLFVSGNDAPKMTYKKMIAGEYINVNTGKVITSYDQITGSVIDSNNNTVLEKDDLNNIEYFDKKTSNFKKYDKLKTKAGKVAFDTSVNVMAKGMVFSKKVEEMLGNTASRFDTIITDVYVEGSDEPVLLAKKLKAGKYYLKTSRVVIRNVKLINDAVIDSDTGNEVLSVEDLDRLIAFEPRYKKFIPLKLSFNILKLAWKYQTQIAPRLAMNNVRLVGKIAKFGIDVVRGRVIVKDVYVGDDKEPRLYATRIRKGEYRLVTNKKVIKHHDDIVDAVEDMDGNIIISYPELEQLRIYKNILNWVNPFKLGKALVKGTVRAAWGLTKTVGNIGIKAFKANTKFIGKAIDATLKFATKPVDVYLPGKKEPVIRARLIESGEYFSAVTGKPIKHHRDIDGAVMDKDGNEIISEEEYEKGIYNISGTKIKGQLGRKLFRGISRLNRMFSIKTKLLNVKRVPKNMNDASKAGLTKTEWIGTKTVSVLEDIKQLLTKKKVAGDSDGDGVREGSYADKMRKKSSGVTGKASAVPNTSKPESDSMFGKLFSWIMDNPMIAGLLTGTAVAGLAVLFSDKIKEKLDAWIDEKWGSVTNAFLAIPADIKSAFTPAIAKFASGVDNFVSSAASLPGKIASGTSSFISAVEGQFSKAATLMERGFAAMDEKLGGKMTQAWDKVTGTFSKSFSWLGDRVGDLINIFKNSPIGKAMTKAGELGKDLFGKAKTLVTNVADNVADSAVGRAASKAVSYGVKGSKVVGKAVSYGVKGLKVVGKALKSVPLLNAGVYGYEAYAEWQEAGEAYKRGEITEDELSEIHKNITGTKLAGWGGSTAAGLAMASTGVGIIGSTVVTGAAGMGSEYAAKKTMGTRSLEEIKAARAAGGQQPANNVVPEQTKSSSSQVPAPIPRQAYAQQSTSERNIVKTSYSGGNQNTAVSTSSNSGYARSVNGGSAVQRPTSNNAQTTNSGYVPRTSGGYGSGELVSVGNNSKRNLHQVFNQGTFVKSNKGIVKASSEGIEKAQPVARIAAIDAVRYRAYGITALEEYRIKSIQYLESKVIDKVTYDSDNTAHLEIDPTTVLNDCMAYFGIKSASSKDATDWSAWFTGRFLPVFTKYMSTIKSVGGGANITDINRTLKMKDQLDIANAIAALPIWSDTNSPWPGYTVNTDPNTIKENINFLTSSTQRSVNEEARSRAANAPRSGNMAENVRNAATAAGGNAGDRGAGTDGMHGNGAGQGDVVVSNNLVEIVTKNGKRALVNSAYAKNFQGFINDLEATGYVIKVLYGYCDRTIKLPGGKDTGKKSMHAYGAAIDINPADNPYTKSNLKTNLPPNITELAYKWGLGWGGNWKSSKDPMHFSIAKNEGGTVNVRGGSTSSTAAAAKASSVPSSNASTKTTSIMINDSNRNYGSSPSNIFGANKFSSSSSSPAPGMGRITDVYRDKKGQDTKQSSGIFGNGGTKAGPAVGGAVPGPKGAADAGPPAQGGGAVMDKLSSTGTPEVNAAINQAATEFKIDPSLMHAMALIESNKKPNAVNGLGFSGLYQFGKPAWKDYGGGEPWSNVLNPLSNSRAAARFIKSNIAKLNKAGIPVNPVNIYLSHQQGPAGFIGLYNAVTKGTPNKYSFQYKQNWPSEAGKYTGNAADFYNGWTKRISNKLGGIDVSSPMSGSPDGKGGEGFDEGAYILAQILGGGKAETITSDKALSDVTSSTVPSPDKAKKSSKKHKGNVKDKAKIDNSGRVYSDDKSSYIDKDGLFHWSNEKVDSTKATTKATTASTTTKATSASGGKSDSGYTSILKKSYSDGDSGIMLPSQVYDPMKTSFNKQPVNKQNNYSEMSSTDSLLSESVDIEKQMLEALISMNNLLNKGIKLHPESINKVASGKAGTDDKEDKSNNAIKNTPNGPELKPYEPPKASVSMKRSVA